MLSLIRVATLAGILSVSVQGAVVLDGRQLRGPGPLVVSQSAHIAAGAQSTVTIGSSTIGLPLASQVTMTSKAFSPPLFTPVGTTAAVGSQGVGGNSATGDANSTGEAGQTFTSVATPVFTPPVRSQELTIEGASAAPTASTVQVVTTHAVTPRV
ncbi:hypothetical protein EDD85DRAFT_956486 [Armillaria nabsnona]|nr:hypothetical protein EDD85DRAFT_956486 [Armillaria nabsnona]